ESGEDELDDWIEVVVTGFAHPDEQGVASHEEFPREIVERAERDLVAAGARTYLALRKGVVAGGGGLRITNGVAQLVGAATAPEFRRQGVQTALLSTRLADAAAAGCDIAVVTTAPGSRSQQNVQRQGFHLLYTRAVLVRGVPPMGDVPHLEASVAGPDEVSVVLYDGPREPIRPLFELAEDSPTQLDSYLADGQVL